MPWFYRSAVKDYQTGHFVIFIHAKWMPLMKHNSDLKQTLEREETEQLRKCQKASSRFHGHYATETATV